MPPQQLGSADRPVIPGADAAQGSAGAGEAAGVPVALRGSVALVAPAFPGVCLPISRVRGGLAFPGAAGLGAQSPLRLGSAKLVRIPGRDELPGSTRGRAFATRAGLVAPSPTPAVHPEAARRGSLPMLRCTWVAPDSSPIDGGELVFPGAAGWGAQAPLQLGSAVLVLFPVVIRLGSSCGRVVAAQTGGWGASGVSLV